jgi:hypothetical protein
MLSSLVVQLHRPNDNILTLTSRERSAESFNTIFTIATVYKWCVWGFQRPHSMSTGGASKSDGFRTGSG